MISLRMPLVITDNRMFRTCYQDLRPGDTIVELLNLKPHEEILFLDLVERGVRIFPSALSQQLSRSKCMQALVYRDRMVPHTAVVRDQHDMVQLIGAYGRSDVGAVITKQNRMNCGRGINLWPSVEEIYNQVCFGSLSFPFVIQPFVENAGDIRVVILGDYLEAYWRENPYSFRNNMHFGGASAPCDLTPEQEAFCLDVMARGKFPYAHIDLMVTPQGATYLGEINLRGGLKGAQISTEVYRARIAQMERAFLQGQSVPAEETA